MAKVPRKLPTSIYQGPIIVNRQKMDVRIDVVGSTFPLDATPWSGQPLGAGADR